MTPNAFDLVAIALILLVTFLGSRKGLFQRLVGIASVAAGIVTVYIALAPIEARLAELLGPGAIAACVAHLVAFLVGALPAALILNGLVKATRATPLRWVDSALGSVIGLLQGGLLVAFVLLPTLLLVPNTREGVRESVFYALVTGDEQPWSSLFEDLSWDPAQLQGLGDRARNAVEGFDPSEAIDSVTEELPSAADLSELADRARERLQEKLEEIDEKLED